MHLILRKTSLHFAAGFFGVQDYQSQYHQLITIENDGQNNTLSPYDNCANANNAVAAFGGVQSTKWANKYLQPALKRIGSQMKGFNLTVTDLLSMQQLCAYEVLVVFFRKFFVAYPLDLIFRLWHLDIPTFATFLTRRNGNHSSILLVSNEYTFNNIFN